MSRTVSFCFDDGFAATAGKVRALFEARGLAATFCVLAAPGETADPFIRAAPVADWGFWREAVAAGHEVEPHGWAHERLADLAPEAALAGFARTFDVFRRELPGFDPAAHACHLAYLTAPPGLVAGLAPQVLGVRQALGGAGLNAAVRPRVDCITFGDPADERLKARLDDFLEDEDGWLVLVLHGLDGEGWGPVRADTLARELDLLLAAGARIETVSRTLRAAA
ncbi:polysaccharide deacetylase family protein [Phenylobacterium sp.]|uniref:polysaccharide deacetylase family protein n=1 Tax=Phenylobacterium sp. TaxID=1871053 RepID=UPI0025DE79F3|nr:polysaccharide deacetylase family protein [Phenylobacterium sp.]MBX3484335.1 polysaccharide deacetylase family protein [Phenylobacterium sp.]